MTFEDWERKELDALIKQNEELLEEFPDDCSLKLNLMSLKQQRQKICGSIS